MRHLLRHTINCIIIFLLSSSANSANIDLTSDGFLPGIIIEGDIVAGDSDKLFDLLRLLSITGSFSRPILLSSKGGDVEEAMKLGRMLRRFRLQSEVPIMALQLDESQHKKDLSFEEYSRLLSQVKTKPRPFCWWKLTDPSNCICASACFLVHAGGVNRFGDVIALHRPFVLPKASKKLMLTQQETAQKAAMTTVRKYLEEMEIPSYYTDLMMSRNSQDAYMVSDKETNDEDHSLTGYVPSIEEITLSRCKPMTHNEYLKQRSIAQKWSSATKADQAEFKQLKDKFELGGRCQEDVVRAMRSEAFDKEFPETIRLRSR